jgi:NhaA family Na+:H+ antiporter
LAGVIAGLLTPAAPPRTAPADTPPPVEALIHRLHGVVSFAIMPLFALANAGIVIGGAELGGDATWVFAGIVLGLVVGKTAGITLASLGASAIGVALLPRGVSRSGIALVGLVGGIGFTMAIFIAQLALPAGPMLETAKLAILVGSGAAAILGLVFGFVVLSRRQRKSPEAEIAHDEAAAESSTEA